MHTFSSGLIFSGILAIAAAGCGGSGEVDVGVTAEPLQAVAPSPGAPDAASQRHLAVTVTEVSVHVAGDEAAAGTPGDQAKAAREGAEAGWTTVFSGNTKVDLLDAAATERLLGSSAVPAGKITQVRLVLSDPELIDGATTSPVACPSCSASGLKIVTEGSVEVTAGGALHLTLDFDQAHSLTQDSSGYRLDPVIKITSVEQR